MKAVWAIFLCSALACNDAAADKCTTEDDCRYLNTCDSDGCCIHKDLMPLKPPEVGASILTFVISAMSNAGGIGGGPIMTPIEILLLYFNTKQSIPLSQVIIAAGALVGLSIRVFMRHPTKNRPLLEYNVSVLIIPPILLGSIFGVMVNKILPNVVVLAMLTVVLVFITLMTLRNGINLYKAETRARKEKSTENTLNNAQSDSGPSMNSNRNEGEIVENAALSNQKESPRVALHSPESVPLESAGADNAPVTPEVSADLAAIYTRESKQFPLIPWCWIIFIVAYVVIGLIIRGGSKGKSLAGLEFCGDGFKVFFALWSFGLLLLTLLPVIYLLRLNKTYDRLSYEYDQFDIRWTVKGCAQVYIAGLLGGFLGSILGFGATLLIAPILVQWRVRAAVVPPTVALMTVLGSAIAVMQFAIQGTLDGEYAGWLALMAFLGAVVGVLLITHLVKKSGRPSFLVLIVAVVLGVAMVIVPIYMIVDALQKEADGKAEYGLKDFCS